MAEFHTVALAASALCGHISWQVRPLDLVHHSFLLAMGTKEEGISGCLGYLSSITRRSVLPALIAAVGIIWSLISILVVIPAFNPKNSSPYAGYYSYLGSNSVEAINILTHPWIPVQRILSEPEYLKSLLMPNCYLARLSP